MASVDADLRSGRRLEIGCRSESIIYNGNLSMEHFFQSAGLLSSWHVQEPKGQVTCINGITIIMCAQCP